MHGLKHFKQESFEALQRSLLTLTPGMLRFPSQQMTQHIA